MEDNRAGNTPDRPLTSFSNGNPTNVANFQSSKQTTWWGVASYLKPLLNIHSASEEKTEPKKSEFKETTKIINQNNKTILPETSTIKKIKEAQLVKSKGVDKTFKGLRQAVDMEKHQKLKEKRDQEQQKIRQKQDEAFEKLTARKPVFVPKKNFKILNEAGTYLCLQSPVKSTKTFVLCKVNNETDSAEQKLDPLIERYENAESRPLAGYNIAKVKLPAEQYAIYKYNGLQVLTKLPDTKHFEPESFINVGTELKTMLSESGIQNTSLSLDSGSGVTEESSDSSDTHGSSGSTEISDSSSENHKKNYLPQ